MSLNLRMRPGDLVYIPDSADTMVYVLGAVHRPGAYRLTPDMSVMDALATAGGPNEDGQPNETGVYRPARQAGRGLRELSRKLCTSLGTVWVHNLGRFNPPLAGTPQKPSP